jgi:guanosine-3',5'-bis(diphosphate) 3'-pyrophosphohydrolase
MRRDLQKTTYSLNLMNPLTQIENFAREAHKGQYRKFAEEPYINHPVRVMECCRKYSTALPVLSAALLHDVLEDTAVTRDELSSFLHRVMSPADADKTLALTIELTDVYVKENFPKWNRRKRKQMEADRLSHISAEGQTIKYADIIDNSNDITNAEPDFVIVFLRECHRLLKVMENGHPTLRKQALEVVNKNMPAKGV